MQFIGRYKWVIGAILFALILNLGPWARAFEPREVISGVSRVTDGAVTTNPGYFYGVAISTDEANQVDVDIYNSGTTSVGSDKLLPSIRVPAASRSKEIFLPQPIPFSGIYIDVTTSGTTHQALFFFRER